MMLLPALLLMTAAIILSVFFSFPYWYGFFLLGGFVFFGYINYRRCSPSIFSYLVRRKYAKFLAVYVFTMFIGFMVDVVYGRTIARLWEYPHLGPVAIILIPVLVYYPLGGLQLYELFYFAKSLIKPNKTRWVVPAETRKILMGLALLTIPAGLLLPALNYVFNSNRNANQLTVVLMALVIFSGDALVYRLKKKSVLLDIMQGSSQMALALIFTWIVGLISHEIPNTYSHEWIYVNIPFTGAEVMGVNILITTFGWLFLVMVPVGWINYFRAIAKLDT